MSTACRIGALTAGLDRSQIEGMSAFGEAFGMVFQIRDDVLDVVASESELGKPPGQDLAEGIYTLPVQRALLDPAVGPRLATFSATRSTSPSARRPGRSWRHRPGSRQPRTRSPAATPRRLPQRRNDLGDAVIPKAFAELSHDVVDDLERSTAAVLAPS